MTTEDYASMQSIAEALKEKKRILVATHINADGDAVGSAIAFACLAINLGSEARLLFVSGVPEYLDWIPRPCPCVQSLKELGSWVPDLLIVTDCGDVKRAGTELENFLSYGFLPANWTETVDSVNIDHHTGNPAFANYNWVQPKAAAASVMVGLLGEYLGVPLTGDFAMAVYTGLVADTGNFCFSNTNAECLSLAARIVDNGLDIGAFTDQYENNWSLERMRIWGRLMSEITLHADGKIAACIVPCSYLADKGLPKSYLEGFAAWLRRLKGVQVGIFIREDHPLKCKLSLRSYGLDIRTVAMLLNGGGHPNAAGAEVDNIAPQELLAKVLVEVTRLL